MSLSESIKLALSSLRTNKMRAFLTLLGVIIGITAVIAILTMGKAIQKQTLDSLEEAGANAFSLEVVARSDEPDNGPEDPNAIYFQSGDSVDKENYFTAEMVDTIRHALAPDLEGVSIGANAFETGKVGTPETEDLESDGKDLAVTPLNVDAFNFTGNVPIAGRALTEQDIADASPVIMLDESTAESLFGSPDAAVGQDVSFASKSGGLVDLRVIGVYGKKNGSGVLTVTGPVTAYVPYSIQGQFEPDTEGAGEYFSTVDVRATATADKNAFHARIESVTDAMYADNPDAEVKVTDQSQFLDSFNQTLKTISMAVAAIGGLALLVGGIGVMNIMLITVTERTREIGVRKALGARRRDIRVQFVTEAMIVCAIGGLLGVVLGSTIGIAGSLLLKSFVFPPLSGILISLLFSLAVGLFFGYYPAAKAAKLNPIDALRYE